MKGEGLETLLNIIITSQNLHHHTSGGCWLGALYIVSARVGRGFFNAMERRSHENTRLLASSVAYIEPFCQIP